MERKGTHRFNRDTVKTLLYVVGAIAGIAFLSSVFYNPVIFVRGTGFAFALFGLLLPFGITYELYNRKPYESLGGIKGSGFALILFFGIMLPGSGTVGMPGFLEIVKPMLCPTGFEEIKSDIAVRQYDMPGLVLTFNREAVCTGELGDYTPGRLPRHLGGMLLYLLYCGMYFSIVALVWKQKFIVLHKYAAQGIILALFIPLLFVTLLNPSFRAVVSKPMNALIYRGHAVSLVEAVKRHKIGMIKELLARGGDIRAEGQDNETALTVAQRYQDKEVLNLFAGQITGGSDSKKALLDKGIVYDQANFVKQVGERERRERQAVPGRGVDINALVALVEGTALTVAVFNGRKDLARFLLDRKADVNKPSEKEWTPLIAAALASTRPSDVCHDDIVLMLIRKGADVHAKTKDGDTALMMASKVACLAAVKVLIENKADVNARNRAGYTALLHAVETTRYDNVYDRVKGYRVDVLDQNSYNLVKYLLEHGADPNVNIYSGGYAGMTPLRMAKFRRVKEVVQLLKSTTGGNNTRRRSRDGSSHSGCAGIRKGPWTR